MTPWESSYYSYYSSIIDIGFSLLKLDHSNLNIFLSRFRSLLQRAKFRETPISLTLIEWFSNDCFDFLRFWFVVRKKSHRESHIFRIGFLKYYYWEFFRQSSKTFCFIRCWLTIWYSDITTKIFAINHGNDLQLKAAVGIDWWLKKSWKVNLNPINANFCTKNQLNF